MPGLPQHAGRSSEGVLRSYLPALVFVALGGALGLLFVCVNTLLYRGRRSTTRARRDPYECGLPSAGVDVARFPVGYVLIALLSLVFAVEVVLLLPLAVVLRDVGEPALFSTVVFLGVLAVAWVYVLCRGALDWPRTTPRPRRAPTPARETPSCARVPEPLPQTLSPPSRASAEPFED